MKKDKDSGPIVFGALLILFGSVWLLDNLGILRINVWDLWPVGLVVWGLYIIYGAMHK